MSPERIAMKRPGPTVSVEALALLLDLEDRRFTVRSQNRQLLVAPTRRLSEATKQAIGVHKDDLCKLVEYVDTV